MASESPFALSAAFRDRFCELLRRATLVLEGDAVSLAEPERFETFVDEQQARDWVVYSKRPFAGPQQVLEYISRYTHRVAISNRRIVDISGEGRVTFTYHDYRDTDRKGRAREKTMQLDAVAFIGRFLRHILPKGFRRIRLYGILAGANRAEKIAAARRLLGPAELPDRADTEETDTEAAVDSPCLCPECGEGTMQRGPILPCIRPPPLVMPWNKAATAHNAA